MRTDDSKSLKAGFVEIMEAKIFSGELKPGDRLPPERELALQLGISRGSVNQGILDMARIVDFAAFIMSYNFAEASSGDAITFRIHDKVLDWNEQEFTVRFHADGTHTLSAEPSPYTAEMSIGTATCMLMGYKRPAYLKSIDRLTADAKTTALLERLIPTGKAYFSDYI